MIRVFAHLLICIFMAACAQVVAPGGGPVDKTPPKVLDYRPDSAQLNFSTKNIQVDFDEFIQLKDLSNQLIISPPLKKTPEITAKGKMLNITFDKEEVLKPNTTYSISFGDAVQDLNENNPIRDFRYIFSTGGFIDSLTLKGKVRDAFNHSTEDGILVMLYSDLGDSVVFNSQPDYFSKTEKDGTFRINNIREGKYKLVAIKDANSNYRYDGDSESIGFLKDTIDPREKQDIIIDIFKERAKKIFLKKYIHDSYGKVSLYFNEGSDSLRVQPLNNTQKGMQEFLEFSRNADTLTYWFKNFIRDTLVLELRNGVKVIDTLNIKVISREAATKSKKNPLKLRVLSSPDGSQGFDLGSAAVITLSNKQQFGYTAETMYTDVVSGATLTEDTITRPVGLIILGSKVIVAAPGDSTSFERIDEQVPFGIDNHMIATYVPKTDWKENTNYKLFIPPGTLTDFFGQTNDTIKVSFHTREEKYYGSVKFVPSYLSDDLNHIIQLVDEQGKVVRQRNCTNPRSIEFNYLPPKKYRLKMIIDDSPRNYRWDTGNYLQRSQPERVIYHDELINIRSNWDAELEWKLPEGVY